MYAVIPQYAISTYWKYFNKVTQYFFHQLICHSSTQLVLSLNQTRPLYCMINLNVPVLDSGNMH